MFQSSPALTGGCYNGDLPLDPVWAAFQSSPALTGGCYLAGGAADADVSCVSILTRPYGRMLFSSLMSASEWERGFNPHPPLRADAIGVLRFRPKRPKSFNPHPPLRADAIRPHCGPDHGKGVSILTRPYGRMLFQSHIGPRQWIPGFNPHPPLRADAMFSLGSSPPVATGGFNPHPPLRADAIAL